eukprot:scaffold130030_cov30-Tisochrysis_lutea.AAC.1
MKNLGADHLETLVGPQIRPRALHGGSHLHLHLERLAKNLHAFSIPPREVRDLVKFRPVIFSSSNSTSLVTTSTVCAPSTGENATSGTTGVLWTLIKSFSGMFC